MLETQALCIKGARLPHLPLAQFQGNTQWETFLPWFWSRKWENHMVVPRVFVYPRSYVTGFFHRGGGKNDWQDDCGGWARISSLFWAMCGERWLVWLCCLNNPVGFFSFFLEPFLLFIYLLSYVCVCAVCVCMKSVWHIHIWACVCVCCVGMPMRWPWRLEVESKLSCLSFFSILFFRDGLTETEAICCDQVGWAARPLRMPLCIPGQVLQVCAVDHSCQVGSGHPFF